MKKILVLVILFLQTFYLSADEKKQDEKAIREVVETWITAWQTCNTQLAIEGFVADADWMNAFGIKTEGKEELANFLDWVFSLPNAKERKDKEMITKIRFIRPDIALVYSDFDVEKQRYVTGEEMTNRKGHILRVLTKESEKWQIVSMFIMDEKAKSPTTDE